MRTLIFSDIHGNALALEYLLQVVNRYEHLQADHYRCLGDIFGYYYDPVQAWKRAYSLDPNLRLGNHDLYMRRMVEGRLGVGAAEDELVAQTIIPQHVRLTQAIESENGLGAQINHLNSDASYLPATETVDGLTLTYVHGTPALTRHTDDHALEYLYPSSEMSKRDKITHALKALPKHQKTDRAIGFIGHTHQPMLTKLAPTNANGDATLRMEFLGGQWTTESEDHPLEIERLNTPPGSPLLINGGSVGQPRLGKSLAHWRIHALHLDTDTRTLRFIALKPPEDVLNQLLDLLYDYRDFTCYNDTDADATAHIREYYRIKAEHTGSRNGTNYLQLSTATSTELRDRWLWCRSELIDRLITGYPAQTERLAYEYTDTHFLVK